ncbi:MAG: hypothetical protein HDR11_02195 [Lachnospiraceae bacterium]|nr:hypothetical protein [Lachnospiraceae bacterium]
MQKETKECAIQEIPDDVKQWLESHRQPFNKILKDIYDDLFQKEFQKRLMWKDGTLWYRDPDQVTMYSVSDLAYELRGTQKYQDELVGPRGGLDSRNRGKEEGKGLAIVLLEQGYLLQESMDREAVEPLEQKLGPFLEECKADNVDREGVILRFKPMFVETTYKNLMRNSELRQNTDRMLLHGYLEPAFESLKSDLTQPDGNVNACAAELLPVISEKVPGKTAEELEGFSRDAAVVKVLLQNLINEYFLTVIEGVRK